MAEHSVTMLDLNRPRSVAELFETAGKLYTRYPLQFIFLAACVVIPFEVIVRLVTGVTTVGRGHVSTDTELLLELIDFALIGPLVSALQVQALFAVADGEHPRPDIVFERALRVLPTVVAAEIVAGIGAGIGLILFVFPGIYLLLRWAVVAQVAAAERVDWVGALRRSGELASRNYLRIAAVLILVFIVTALISNIVGSIVGNSNTIGSDAIEIVMLVLLQSFASLVTALLYFDLYSREGA